MATLIGNWSPLSGLNTAILQGLDFQVVVNEDVPICTQQTLSSQGVFFLDPNPQHTSYRHDRIQGSVQTILPRFVYSRSMKFAKKQA